MEMEYGMDGAKHFACIRTPKWKREKKKEFIDCSSF